MTKIAIYFFIVLIVFFSTSVPAKNFAMRQYTTADGLPSNTIYTIYKDARGHLWFCTDKGIARYNGIAFEQFNTSNGLPDNEIFFVKEDKKGRLWLATFNGELCFYKDDKFHTTANTPFLKLPFKKTYIQSIDIAEDGTIIIGYYDRAKWVFISDNNVSVKLFDKIIKHFDTNFQHIDKIADNKYAMHFTDRIIVCDADSKIIKQQLFQNNNKYKYAVSEHQDYLYTADSVYTIDEKPIAAINKNAYAQNYIYHIYVYDNNVFYCTDKGLYINNNIEAFNNQKISTIERDINGNYWISVLGNGVVSLSKDFLAIDKYQNCYEGIIKYAKADRGAIFFANDNNNLYSLRRGSIETVTPKYLAHTRSTKPPDYQAFYIDSAGSYYCFNDNDIFVTDSIHANNHVSKQFKSYFAGGYKSIFSDGKYTYLKRFRTIEYIDFSKTKKTHSASFPIIELKPYVLSKERIFGMALDDNNAIWYSTIDSMYKVVNGVLYAQPQYKNIAFKWFEIPGNYLIGCTHDNKLVVCNNASDKMYFDIVGDQNCIWDKLYKLDATHFLLSTNNLYRILTLLPADTVPVYSIQAIENPYVPINAENICADGKKCFFFKDGSITAIDINTLLEKPNPPELSFKRLKSAKKTYVINSDVNLPFSKAQNISISFFTLAFSGTDILHQYSFSEDETDNWIDIHGDINIIHPDFGNYTVKVRAKSTSSSFSEPISFRLHILRPYWATWWFITLSVLLFVLLFIVVIRYRISRAVLKKQNLHDNEIRFMKAEYKAMNALMNPHFIFNTLNNVQDLINKNDKRAANEYLRFFADLIRQNLHNISKELVSLQKELNLVNNYLLLEKLRFEDYMNYSIDIDDDIDLSEIMVPPLLIQPLVENAIKHGIYPLQSADGFLRVRVYEDKNIVHIDVMDNGVGMGAKNMNSTTHESFGLHNIKTRIEQLSLIQNKEIQFQISEVKDENEKQLWTVVSISIPIS
jgi:two-component sensor histidine kinase